MSDISSVLEAISPVKVILAEDIEARDVESPDKVWVIWIKYHVDVL